MKLKLPFGNNNNNEDAEAEQPMVNEEAEPTLVDEEPDVSKEKSRAPSVHYGDEKWVCIVRYEYFAALVS